MLLTICEIYRFTAFNIGIFAFCRIS